MKTFENKVVAITGAASGVGRALAIELARHGAHVSLCDVDTIGLNQTLQRMRAQRTDVRVLMRQVDVADRAAVFAWRDATLTEFGCVDIVINNAGVSVSSRVEDLSEADLRWIVDINWWGVVHGTQAFIPALKLRPSASLVNISSVFGLVAVPTQAAYNATKFAVRGFTEALRHEFEGTPLHVMCVHPGGIRTNIVRHARNHEMPDGSTDAARAIQDFDRIARTSPEQAARIILRDILARRPRCLIGADARFLSLLARLFPVRYWSVLRPALKRQRGIAQRASSQAEAQ